MTAGEVIIAICVVVMGYYIVRAILLINEKDEKDD